MATSTYTYGKYFSSATASTGTTTLSFSNLFNAVNSSRLWSDLVNLVYGKLFTQLESNVRCYTSEMIPMSANTYTTLPVRYYFGNIWGTITFVNVSNQTSSEIFNVTFTDGRISSTNKSNVVSSLVARWGDSCAKECYFTNIRFADVKFYFAIPDQYGFSSACLRNSDRTPLTTSSGISFNYNFSRNQTSSYRVLVTMSRVTADLSLSYGTSRIARNLTTSGAAFKLNKTLNYNFYPLFLESLRSTDFMKGYNISTSMIPADTLNHQTFMSDNASVKIGQAITAFTRSGQLPTSTNSVTFTNLVYGAVDDSSTITQCTHSFTWRASGYNFYRNTGQTQDITDESHPEYAQYNTYSTTYLNIYPKAISQTCYETMYICLYDVNEGQISYQGNGSDLVNRYYVPPTDILSTQYEDNIRSVHKSTEYRYTFNAETFQMTYDGQTIHQSQIVSDCVPTYNFPKIGVFKFTSKGETLPASASGWIVYSCENNVLSNGTWYGTSVRYHLTGHDEIKYGSKTSGGNNTYYRNSILYIGVKKNDLDFIAGITDRAYQYWNDEISGINYTTPIAYANKVSTMNDLADKLTCFHGRAAFYYLDDDTYEYLYDMRDWFLYQLWTGGCNFQSKYNGYAATTTPVKYRSVTINGTTYSELNWPMRWYNYPTWTSATATSFTYYAGLVMKKPFSSFDGDLYIADYVSENSWNSALTSTVSFGSGGGSYIFVYYNGLRGTTTAGGPWPFNVIVSNTNTTWNRDRRGIGDYERNGNGGTNFETSTILRDWIYDTTGNFDDSIGQGYEGHRYISIDSNNILPTNTYLYIEPM